MKTHTPGPWEFQKHDAGRYYGNIVGYYSRYETEPEKGNQIRTITIQLNHGTDEENAANAKLIAAAPDLLEALKMAHSEIHGECDFTKEQLLKIEAAIKKAQP
jgi:hypothetical protein